MTKAPVMCEPEIESKADRNARPRALIMRAAGTNCDRELMHAFRLAGADPQEVHVSELRRDPSIVDRYDLIGVPGGFSFGDDIAAGKIFALLIKDGVQQAMQRAVDRGVPIFAPCNGFQILVKMGLLPDLAPSGTEQTVTLVDNIDGRFIDRWLEVEIEQGCHCIWTRGIRRAAPASMLPIAHGEGRFVAPERVLEALETENRIALRYAAGHNANGSANRIAGICDSTGLVLGLMPHPERFTSYLHHPMRTRLDEATLAGKPLGLAMFENAVEQARSIVRG